MVKIGLVTDSSSDIPPEIAGKYGIEVVPLYIGLDGNNYRDQIDITPDTVFSALKEGKKVTTAAPSVGDFQKIFKKLLDRDSAEVIYCVTLSSRLSGTYNAANIARNSFPGSKIKVIDSRSSTICLGLILIQAAEAIKAGNGEESIDNLISELVEKNKFIATLESFEYVFKGGRAVFFGRLIEKAVRLIPVLNIGRNGKIRLKKFVKTKHNALIEIYKSSVSEAKKNSSNIIGIFYGSDLGPAEQLKELFAHNDEIKIDEILVTRITTVISAHTGPSIWGIAVSPRILP